MQVQRPSWPPAKESPRKAAQNQMMFFWDLSTCLYTGTWMWCHRHGQCLCVHHPQGFLVKLRKTPSLLEGCSLRASEWLEEQRTGLMLVGAPWTVNNLHNCTWKPWSVNMVFIPDLWEDAGTGNPNLPLPAWWMLLMALWHSSHWF